MKIVIIGANRGIGLEYCKQYKEKGNEVIALCRNTSKELSNLGIIVIEGVEVTNFENLKGVAKKIGEKSVDLLIHNAGILRDENLQQMNFETIEEQFRVNALAPLKSIMAFLPCLKDGAKLGLMSSRMGSVEDNTSGGRYGYRMSKCALNIMGKSLSLDLVPRNISVAILHPGYVRTDMTDGNGNINADESVKGLISCMEKLNMDNTGKYWHFQGAELPW